MGLDAVDALLAANPEARAKLSERLTGPSAGGSNKRARTAAAGGGGGQMGSNGRRVVLAGPVARAMQLPGLPAALAALPEASAASSLPSNLLGSMQLCLPPDPLGTGALPALSLLQADEAGCPAATAAAAAAAQPAASLGFTDWLRQVAAPSCSVQAPAAGEEVAQQPGQRVAEQPAGPQQQLPALLPLLPVPELMQPGSVASPPAAALPHHSAAPQAAQLMQPRPLEGSHVSPHRAGAAAESPAAAAPTEVVPLDAVLQAWERHDAVRRQLTAAQTQLEQQRQQVAALQQQLQTAQVKLAALEGAGQAPAFSELPGTAAAASLHRGVPAELARLLQQHTQLLPFASTICELAGQAVGAALATAGSPAASTPSPSP